MPLVMFKQSDHSHLAISHQHMPVMLISAFADPLTLGFGSYRSIGCAI